MPLCVLGTSHCTQLHVELQRLPTWGPLIMERNMTDSVQIASTLRPSGTSG